MRDEGLEKRMERASRATEARVLRDLGFFGHFLHVHAGGRGGKQYILSRLLRSGGAMTQRELQEHAHVTAAALMGADIATVPFGALKNCVKHPLTAEGLAKFEADWEKVKNA